MKWKIRYERILLLYIYIALLFIPCSCKKFIEVDSPKNQLISSTVFLDDATATSAVVGIYSKMMGDFGPLFASGGCTLYPALSSDELITRKPDYAEIAQNSISPANPIMRRLWDNAYEYIYDATAVVEGLNQSTQISTSTKSQLLGEAKFIRAFCYFYLVNLFGDVPLVSITSYDVNKNLPRSSSNEIYQFIANELTEAESVLGSDYISKDRGRPNKWTAASLLARVYLFEKDWAKAESESSKVINSGMYSLSDIGGIFLKGSGETIWQMMPVNLGYTWEAYLMIPTGTVIPQFFATESLLSSFENNDQRRISWLKSITVQGQIYYYPYKYKSKVNQGFSEYYVVMRLAELYLIRAEARSQMNNLADALMDVNAIRARANLPDTGSLSQNELLATIQHENRIEFFAEWGHRWFDLKRTNKASEVLGILKSSTWQATDTLYPIPQLEILNNPSLSQNLGY